MIAVFQYYRQEIWKHTIENLKKENAETAEDVLFILYKLRRDGVDCEIMCEMKKEVNDSRNKIIYKNRNSDTDKVANERMCDLLYIIVAYVVECNYNDDKTNSDEHLWNARVLFV